MSGNEAAAPLGAAENFGFPPNFGRAGEDFPIYGPHNMPATTFSCEGKVKGGYDLRSFFAFFVFVAAVKKVTGVHNFKFRLQTF